MDSDTISNVYQELEKADVCLVIGTSSLVQPAASFPLIVKQGGGLIIEVNIERTPLTSAVDYHLSGKAGEILPQVDLLLTPQ